jgi:hypothetical protein
MCTATGGEGFLWLLGPPNYSEALGTQSSIESWVSSRSIHLADVAPCGWDSGCQAKQHLAVHSAGPLASLERMALSRRLTNGSVEVVDKWLCRGGCFLLAGDVFPLLFIPAKHGRQAEAARVPPRDYTAVPKGRRKRLKSILGCVFMLFVVGFFGNQLASWTFRSLAKFAEGEVQQAK